MQKAAFFLNNPTLSRGDYTTIMDGNPGVGGSEYEFMLVPYLLEKRDNGIEPCLITNCEANFPHRNVAYVNNLLGCCNYCVQNGIDVLVIDIKHFDKTVCDEFSGKINVAIWAHNNVSYSQLKMFWHLDYVKKIVNCGREELELYRDHIATLKSTYIYNIFPFKDKEYYSSKIKDVDNHNVVYMGSIVKVKGFHVLAKAWKKILKAVPDAQLYVIGSGKLYNQRAKLGKFGIADEKYEDLFMHHLLDSNGEMLKSVHFLGLLGNEKYDVMGRCKVGVPNPTGFSETFCICGIEMQLMGGNITTIEHPAYLDTVLNKHYLYKSTSQLAKYVIDRLTGHRDNSDDLYDFVTKKFGIDGNIQRWEKLILNIESDMVEPISEYGFQHKKLKERILRFKVKHKWAEGMPCIEQCYLIGQEMTGRYHQVCDLLERKYYGK